MSEKTSKALRKEGCEIKYTMTITVRKDGNVGLQGMLPADHHRVLDILHAAEHVVMGKAVVDAQAGKERPRIITGKGPVVVPAQTIPVSGTPTKQ